MEPSPQKSSHFIPIAIIFGFAMIAIAIFLTNSSERKVTVVTPQNAEDLVNTEGVARPIDGTDYIRGNPNAPIMMIEYSDYDCPFCKQFHGTMIQVMDEYGVTGQLGWVYRQFPLSQLHPNSPLISKAALCVGEIGGNDAFWEFSDMIYDRRELDSQTNVTKLQGYAEEVGVSAAEYNNCIQGSEMDEKLEASLTDGYNSGARGTPYTVLIVGDQQAVINGAQPYTVVKGLVANLVDQLEGNIDPSATETPNVKRNVSGVPLVE